MGRIEHILRPDETSTTSFMSSTASATISATAAAATTTSAEDATCPEHDLFAVATDYIVGSLTFHDLSKIIAGACAGIAILVMIGFKTMHATHLSTPTEQVKIMRIGNLITMYALISFLSVCFPNASVYIEPWLEVVEAAAMGSFFLLLCDYISPNQSQREVFFAAKRKGGVKWFKVRWAMIFQFPIVAFIMALVTDISAAVGTFCEFGKGVKALSFWVKLISTLSLGMTLIAILQFYKALKTDISQHKPMLKLVSFKAVVFLTFVQGILFWILQSTKALKETDTLTFADVHIVIPNLVICIEMVPLCFFFMYAYPWAPYLRNNSDIEGVEGAIKYTKPYQGGPLGIYAWLYMLNPSDTLQAILYALRGFPNKDQSRQPNPDQAMEPLRPEPYTGA